MLTKMPVTTLALPVFRAGKLEMKQNNTQPEKYSKSWISCQEIWVHLFQANGQGPVVQN